MILTGGGVGDEASVAPAPGGKEMRGKTGIGQLLSRRSRPEDALGERVPGRGGIDEACLIALRAGIQSILFRSQSRAVPALLPQAAVAQSRQAEMILGLLAALEAKDAYTAWHSIRVEGYARPLAARLGLDEERMRHVCVGAVLHDLGKIGIADAILTKPGTLTKTEFEAMKQHTTIGDAVLRPIRFLDAVRPIVLHHHEWYDGSGYPAGLRGEAIPLEARIVQVADCIDAMMSPRCYRRALTRPEVIHELQTGGGRQFDPMVAEISIRSLRMDMAAAALAH